jgi:hypothetical protein
MTAILPSPKSVPARLMPSAGVKVTGSTGYGEGEILGVIAGTPEADKVSGRADVMSAGCIDGDGPEP